jgi:hypothetical protein
MMFNGGEVEIDIPAQVGAAVAVSETTPNCISISALMP